MGDEHWQRVRIGRALVDEVDIESVDGGREVVERVESPFLVPPVVPRLPVVDQLAEIRQVGALAPSDALDLVGETGAGQTFLEICQYRVRHGDHERADAHRVVGGGWGGGWGVGGWSRRFGRCWLAATGRDRQTECQDTASKGRRNHRMFLSIGTNGDYRVQTGHMSVIMPDPDEVDPTFRGVPFGYARRWCAVTSVRRGPGHRDGRRGMIST